LIKVFKDPRFPDSFRTMALKRLIDMKSWLELKTLIPIVEDEGRSLELRTVALRALALMMGVKESKELKPELLLERIAQDARLPFAFRCRAFLAMPSSVRSEAVDLEMKRLIAARAGLDQVPPDFIPVLKGLLKGSNLRLGVVLSSQASLLAADSFLRALKMKNVILYASLELTPKQFKKRFPRYPVEEYLYSSRFPKNIVAVDFEDTAVPSQWKEREFRLPFVPFKFGPPAKVDEEERRAFKEALGIGSRQVIVLGSPTQKEFSYFMKSYAALFNERPVAERPVVIAGFRLFNNRFQGIPSADVEGQSCVVRDRVDDPFPDMSRHNVLVLTTMGEMDKMYSIQNVTVMGEDHNPLQPAGHGAAILYFDGEWSNNQDGLDLLTKGGAARPFSKEALWELTQKADLRKEMGARAERAAKRIQQEFIPKATQDAALSMVAFLTMDSLAEARSGAPNSLLYRLVRLGWELLGLEKGKAVPWIGYAGMAGEMVFGLFYASSLGRWTAEALLPAAFASPLFGLGVFFLAVAALHKAMEILERYLIWGLPKFWSGPWSDVEDDLRDILRQWLMFLPYVFYSLDASLSWAIPFGLIAVGIHLVYDVLEISPDSRAAGTLRKGKQVLEKAVFGTKKQEAPPPLPREISPEEEMRILSARGYRVFPGQKFVEKGGRRFILEKGSRRSFETQVDLYERAGRRSRKYFLKPVEYIEEAGIVVLPSVEGTDVETLLAGGIAHLSIWQRLDIMRQVMEALETMHRLGFVHNNVIPEKIVIDRDGRVFLTGFQLVGKKVVLEGPGAFKSPERLGSFYHAVKDMEVSRKSDIYSAALILLELLAGRWLSPVPLRPPPHPLHLTLEEIRNEDDARVESKVAELLADVPDLFRQKLVDLCMGGLKRNVRDRELTSQAIGEMMKSMVFEKTMRLRLGGPLPYEGGEVQSSINELENALAEAEVLPERAMRESFNNMVGHLMDNAILAVKEVGQGFVRLAAFRDKEGKIVLSVEDSGVGILREVLDLLGKGKEISPEARAKFALRYGEGIGVERGLARARELGVLRMEVETWQNGVSWKKVFIPSPETIEPGSRPAAGTQWRITFPAPSRHGGGSPTHFHTLGLPALVPLLEKLFRWATGKEARWLTPEGIAYGRMLRDVFGLAVGLTPALATPEGIVIGTHWMENGGREGGPAPGGNPKPVSPAAPPSAPGGLPRAMDLRLWEGEAYPRGLGKIRREDVEARFVAEAGETRDNAKWIELADFFSRLRQDLGPVDSYSASLSWTAADLKTLAEPTLSLRAVTALAILKEDPRSRRALAARLLEVGQELENLPQFLAGILALQWAGSGLWKEVGAPLELAQIMDAELVFQVLAFTGQAAGKTPDQAREILQDMLSRYADPVLKKMEKLKRFKSAGREAGERATGPVEMDLDNYKSWTEEELLQRAAFLAGLAAAGLKKGSPVVVTAEEEEKMLKPVLLQACPDLKKVWKVVTPREVPGLYKGGKLRLGILQSRLPRSLSLVYAETEDDVEREGSPVEVKTFRSLAQEIEKDIERLVYLLLQA
jgi:hypothetical protein